MNVLIVYAQYAIYKVYLIILEVNPSIVIQFG